MMWRSRRGLSLVELLMALAISGIAIFVMISSAQTTLSAASKVNATRGREKALQSVLQTIIKNAPSYQVNFDTSEAHVAKLLDPSKLPWAWDDGRVLPADQCPECAGRLGFVLQPHALVPGAYRLRVRIKHPSIGDQARDYTYIIGGGS